MSAARRHEDDSAGAGAGAGAAVADVAAELWQVDVRRWAILDLLREHGSIVAVARVMGVTNHTVSTHLHRLEAETQTCLLRRGTRGARGARGVEGAQGARLTPAGIQLADAWLSIATSIRTTYNHLHSDEPRARRVALVTVPSATSSVLPFAIARLARAEPDLHLELTPKDLPGALRAVNTRSTEAGLVWHYRDEPLELRAEVELAHVFVERTIVVASNRHPLARADRVPFTDLLDQTIISRRGGDRATAALRSAARRIGGDAHVGAIASDTSEQQGLVATGMGLAAVPELASYAMRDDICVLPVHDMPIPERIVSMIWAEDAVETRYRHAVTRSVTEAATELQNRIAARLPSALPARRELPGPTIDPT